MKLKYRGYNNINRNNMQDRGNGVDMRTVNDRSNNINKNKIRRNKRKRRRVLSFVIVGFIFFMFAKFDLLGEHSPINYIKDNLFGDTTVDSVIDVFKSKANDIENNDVIEDGFLATMDNIDRLKTFEDVRKYLYYVDETAYADEKVLDIKKLLKIDLKTKITDKPKILIFHTHSQEDFINSREGVVADTIVGVGSVLADILAKDYGVTVVHDFGQYDVVDGRNERGASYERMEPVVKEILKKYPSVEVVIDLHRDGVSDDVHLVTEIDGQQVARVMYFNGVSCENNGESGKPIASLRNPYQEENLAFSLKMQLATNKLYPGLTRKLYIKPYRYSLHMKPKSLLIEVGANTNTVEEAKAAMKPLAKVLSEVIIEK